MEDIILYHGSRGGLVEEIKPQSHDECDFGRGFYMGTNPQLIKSLVCEDIKPIFYTLKLKLSEIPEDRILRLDGEDWINTVLVNRRENSDYITPALTSVVIHKLEKYDIIYGVMADDRMNEAIKRFMRNELTTKGLMACLKSVDYGVQYIAKTEFACSKIEIYTNREVVGSELRAARDYGLAKINEGIVVVNKMAKLYLHEGKYLSELIKEQNTLPKATKV